MFFVNKVMPSRGDVRGGFFFKNLAGERTSLDIKISALLFFAATVEIFRMFNLLWK